MRSCICLVIAAGTLPTGPAVLHAEDPIIRAKSLEFDPQSGDWVDQPPPEPGTPLGDLQLARMAYSGGEYRSAAKAVKKWYGAHGDLNELYPQAVLLDCRIMIARRAYYKAYVRLQSFLNEFPGGGYQEDALTMEFNIAEIFLRGTKRKFLGMRILKADDIALSILDDITANFPQSRLAELSMLEKANYYFQSGDFAFAEQEYKELMEGYPRSRYVRPATLQRARAALASFPGVEFDDAPLIEAEDQFLRYLAQYPGSAEQEGVGLIVRDIGETRAAKEYETGRYYERTKQPRAARFYYKSTRRHWPDTVAAIRAAERLEVIGEEEPPRDDPVVPGAPPDADGERIDAPTDEVDEGVEAEEAEGVFVEPEDGDEGGENVWIDLDERNAPE